MRKAIKPTKAERRYVLSEFIDWLSPVDDRWGDIVDDDFAVEQGFRAAGLRGAADLERGILEKRLERWGKKALERDGA